VTSGASRTCGSRRRRSFSARAAGASDVHPVRRSNDQTWFDQGGENLLDAVAVQAPQPRGLQRCHAQGGTLKELATFLERTSAGARPAAWRSGKRRARRACRATARARCAGAKCRHELIEVSRTALGARGRSVAGHKRLEPMAAVTAGELEQWHSGEIQKSAGGDS
jgi:hypothetical protein